MTPCGPAAAPAPVAGPLHLFHDPLDHPCARRCSVGVGTGNVISPAPSARFDLACGQRRTGNTAKRQTFDSNAAISIASNAAKCVAVLPCCCYASNMKTIAIISQKGGAGKTTLALHLAAAAEAAGKATVVIDLDPQASAAGWKDSRSEETPVVISLPHTRLTQGLQAAREGGARLAVIDTAPHSEAAAMAAARAADLVLIPCRAGILDLRAIATTAELVKLAQKRAFVVLNALPPRATQLLNDARGAVEVHGLEVGPVVLQQRAAFAHALTAGQTAQEYEPDGKAAEEIAALLSWLEGILQA